MSWKRLRLSCAPLKAETTQRCSFASKLASTQEPASCVLFDFVVVSELPGIIHLNIAGNGAWELFRFESGGHRWQRVPPTEKRGRTQTSTFTVAVFQWARTRTKAFRLSDVVFQTTKGSGPGGQHRNKTESAVRAIHCPTNTVVFCQNNRSQHVNKAEAIRLLEKKVETLASESTESRRIKSRNAQTGSGQRGDKIRTVQVQNGRVVNHANNRKVSFNRYNKGQVWLLNE